VQSHIFITRVPTHNGGDNQDEHEDESHGGKSIVTADKLSSTEGRVFKILEGAIPMPLLIPRN